MAEHRIIDGHQRVHVTLDGHRIDLAVVDDDDYQNAGAVELSAEAATQVRDALTEVLREHDDA